MKRRAGRGQALVEYILLAAVFLVVTYGVAQLFGSAWKAKFNKIQHTRAGVIGIAP